MERKVLELYVPYNDKGEVKEKYFKISFISNRMDREYRALMVRQQEAMALVQKYTYNLEDQGSAIIDKTPKIKERTEKAKKLREEGKKLNAQIASFEGSDFFKDRVDLIHIILMENGVIDEEALTFEFWDEKVDPADLVNFVESAVTKDYVEKKKLSLNAMKTA